MSPVVSAATLLIIPRMNFAVAPGSCSKLSSGFVVQILTSGAKTSADEPYLVLEWSTISSSAGSWFCILGSWLSTTRYVVPRWFTTEMRSS